MCLRNQDFSPGGIHSVQRGWRPELCVLLFLVMNCVTPTAGWDRHMLEVQNTVQRGSNSDLQLLQTTLFNGDIIFHCESPTLTDQPRQEWVKDTFSPKELKNKNKFCVRQFYEHLQWFEEIDRIINGTAEILQRRRGCIINGSGLFPFDQWAINGEAFLTFDLQTLTWMPQTEQATSAAVKWNQLDLKNQIRNHVYGDFCQTVCRTSHSLVKREKQVQGHRAAHSDMEVRVFIKPIPGSTDTYLKCHVTASDLSGVRIQLTKDGVPLDGEVNLTGPLPNGDGTVQMRVQVQVPQTLKGSEGYQCSVHRDANQTTVTCDGQTPSSDSSSKPLDHDQQTVCGVLVCTVALVAIVVYTFIRLNLQKLTNVRCVSVEQPIRLYLQFVLSEEEYDKWMKIADNFYGKYEMVLKRTRLEPWNQENIYVENGSDYIFVIYFLIVL
ncbi:major histocompatibility complex class I-related gene protein-like isoform X2 [Alosa sapidissima]|uniref:major histocompatibility complex class I-related gene protein-like isoform X2 n=1 Tax=Alosa sapidissima TaxID=34773 RepID=UPI001C099170|nr:major histocompatibility complex class I-related gene protein-like isoform X2 [Alosa sapidissima]